MTDNERHRAGRYNPAERTATMFITMKFTTRERYCKACNHLLRNRNKYNLINRGKDQAEGGWYVYFSKRVQKG